MGMPPILPTGAMSSGDYVSYMMEYNEAAILVTADDLGDYMTQSTMNDWNNVWGHQLTDARTSVTDLETAVRKMKTQVGMLKDAVDKL